ncbi:MAG TPA: TetR/AcrR family transcriptional regulator [Planctomycetota bacterium]|nr:TetR/AcrR family transcriptional regulator [Planctomycetota bacterium]
MTTIAHNDRLARRREAILDEATLLFAAQGYSRAKVDDLAVKLGLGKGTIYRYFPTKEELFLAVADNAMESLQHTMLSATQHIEDPFARIAAAVTAYLSFFDSNLHLIEIFVHERAEFRDRNTPTYLTYRDKNLKNLERLLASMKHAGIVRDIDEGTTAALMGDMLYGTVYTHFLRGGGKSLKRLAPRILDIFFEGILTLPGRAQRNRKGQSGKRNLIGN